MKRLIFFLAAVSFAQPPILPQPYSVTSTNYRCDVEMLDNIGSVGVSCFQGTAIAGRGILTAAINGKGSVFVVEEIAVLLKRNGTTVQIQVSKADITNPNSVMVFDGVLPTTTTRLRQWFLWFF